MSSFIKIDDGEVEVIGWFDLEWPRCCS